MKKVNNFESSIFEEKIIKNYIRNELCGCQIVTN